LIGRDYAQQEIRILAHFEDGLLLQQYDENPHIDIHLLAKVLLEERLGVKFEDRRIVKALSFGLMYGLGVTGMSKKIGEDYRTTKQLKEAYLKIFPGLKELIKAIRERVVNGEPICTWAGREYFVEEPKWNEEERRWQTFEYKLINYLIQGSAADCTKEAIIRWYGVKHEDTRMLINVHDELLGNTPKKLKAQEMKILKDSLESVEFDVPMFTDGKYSLHNWGAMKKYKDLAA